MHSCLQVHTSNVAFSGTDNWIRMKITARHGHDVVHCLTDYLDNKGNDREYGQIDIHSGDQLGNEYIKVLRKLMQPFFKGNCTRILRDEVDSAPEDTSALIRTMQYRNGKLLSRLLRIFYV